MRASELRRYISFLKLTRTGTRCVVCAANELPHHVVLRRPAAFIVNTQPNYRPGAHWVLIYLPQKKNMDSTLTPYFFDSLGYPPSAYRQHFIKFLKKNNSPSHTYRFNRVKIQQDNSSACGMYCLFFFKSLLSTDTCNSTQNIIKLMSSVSEKTMMHSLNDN